MHTRSSQKLATLTLYVSSMLVNKRSMLRYVQTAHQVVCVHLQTLSDDNKRKQYDMFGHDAEQMGGFGGGDGNPFGGAGNPFGNMGGMGGGGMGGMNFQDADEFFKTVFGGGFGAKPQRGPKKGADLQTTLTIDFMEAVNGCKKEINVRSGATCHTCNGSGDKPGTKPKTCSACSGRGSVS